MIRSIINSAKEWGLTEWDWIAIVIAILSFTASIISIGIAYKTLKSQVKTQNNTRLLLSQNAGYEYLKSYISCIIISYMYLTIFDEIAKWAHKKHQIIFDYSPLFFLKLSLSVDGIRPDHFISYPSVYAHLNDVNSYIRKYNELLDYIKKKILGNSINVNYLSHNGSIPYTHIVEAQKFLMDISRDLLKTIEIIKSENEKEGDELSQDDIVSLQREIDTQILESFTAINIKREVSSKDLDECLFDGSILDWIIKDSKIKETVSSIYYHICRVSFFDKEDYFVFRGDIQPSRKEIIVNEIRTFIFKEEPDNAFRKVSEYFIEDINKIGRKALTFAPKDEDMPKKFFMKEVKRIRKFYTFLYERINSSVPQSLESIDFEKWNSFNTCEWGPWTPPEVVGLSGDSVKIMK